MSTRRFLVLALLSAGFAYGSGETVVPHRLVVSGQGSLSEKDQSIVVRQNKAVMALMRSLNHNYADRSRVSSDEFSSSAWQQWLALTKRFYQQSESSIPKKMVSVVAHIPRLQSESAERIQLEVPVLVSIDGQEFLYPIWMQYTDRIEAIGCNGHG